MAESKCLDLVIPWKGVVATWLKSWRQSSRGSNSTEIETDKATMEFEFLTWQFFTYCH